MNLKLKIQVLLIFKFLFLFLFYFIFHSFFFFFLFFFFFFFFFYFLFFFFFFSFFFFKEKITSSGLVVPMLIFQDVISSTRLTSRVTGLNLLNSHWSEADLASFRLFYCSLCSDPKTPPIGFQILSTRSPTSRIYPLFLFSSFYIDF